MARNYEKNKELNKGLKKVNIGYNIWLFGRQKHVTLPDNKNMKSLHMVIYGPKNKEYHVWGKDVENMINDDDYGNNGYVSRDGNKASEEKVKIYILTSILDENTNWCFDLTKIPNIGKLKVIYDNGTVKNIDFDGVFSEVEVVNQFWKNKHGINIEKKITPVGYRK